MEYQTKKDIPYEEIENGALLLLLLRETKTWEELCGRYAYADPAQLMANTNTMMVLKKLFDMRELGLLTFQCEETGAGKKPVGEIKETDLWSKIRVAFGGMSLSETALLSRHSKGMAVVPVFGRPRQPQEKIDVFVGGNAGQNSPQGGPTTGGAKSLGIGKHFRYTFRKGQS